MDERKTGRTISSSAMRGAVTFAAFLALSKLTSLCIKAICVLGDEKGFFKSLPNFVIYITCTVGAVLIFNSFASAFAVYDRGARNEFIESEYNDIRFFKDVKGILVSPQFITEAAVSLTLIFIVSAAGVFPEIGGIFFPDGSKRAGLFPALILTPICFFVLLLSKYEAMRYWHKLEREKDIEKLDNPMRYAVRILIIVILYPIIFPLSPLLGFMIGSLISIIIGVTNALGAISAILAVISIILLILGVSLLCAMSKRRKFIKALRAAVSKKGYTVSEITNPYISFVRSTKRCGFILEANGERFACTVISTLHKRIPLIFTSPTDAYFRHRIGSKNHHFTLNHNIEFYPAGEGKHLLIVNPMPKNRVFIEDGTLEAQVVSGDKLWSFILYDAASFLSAIDRDCLGRENGD